MTFRQLVYTLEERFPGNWVLECQIRLEGLFVQLLVKAWVFQKGLDLRTDKEGAIHLGVIQRLDTKVIARTKHFLGLAIPDDKGKHPPQLFADIIAPFLVTMQNDFRVRLS